MAADAPAGRPAFACGRPEKPAGDPFERVPVGFPGPDASPRAVPVAGATSGGASEGLITPPDVNRVGIPALDQKTSPGGQGTSPGSARALRRTSPRGKSTPEPRGVADGASPPRVKLQFGESVLSREAENTSVLFFLEKLQDLVPPDAPSERAARASGPAEDPRLRGRDETMSSREICKYFLHGACRNGASCRFSHEMSAPKSTVCTYYLAGNCAYGDKCRYDHVRPKVRAPIERGARSDIARGVPRPPPQESPARLGSNPDRPATTSPTFLLGRVGTPAASDLLFSPSRGSRVFFAFSRLG